MKRLLFALALGGASLLAAPTTTLAQTRDTTSTAKPQLNTAPPGTAKPELNTAPPGAAPRPRTSPRYEQTAPAVPAPPPIDEPLPSQRPRPSVDSPSGLDFPAGSRASEQPKHLTKYFLYSNFGLGYNSYNGYGQFNASIAPALGYRVTDKLSIGPGIAYSYNNYSFASGYFGANTPKTNYGFKNLGFKVFGQYMFYKQFFAHAEYEVTQAELPAQDPNNGAFVKYKTTVYTPLAGVGYRQQFSDRAAADIVLLYNFNNNIVTDIYGQPVIRFSFLFNIGK